MQINSVRVKLGNLDRNNTVYILHTLQRYKDIIHLVISSLLVISIFRDKSEEMFKDVLLLDSPSTSN